MKKIIFATIAATALLTACDPSVGNITTPEDTPVTPEQLENGFTYTQFALVNDAYVPASDGNYIQFSTNPSAVVKIWINGADGTPQVLTSGTANGMFPLAPPRGSNPNQTVYITTRAWDGTEITVSKVITVAVATELSKEMLLLCSNDGSKTWKWDADGGQIWGNFGYTPGSGEDFAENRSGIWWGVTSTEEFADQQQHRGGDSVTGDDNTDATMVFYETGIVKCFDAAGGEIRKGSFSIENYDPVNKKVINDQAWSVGQLKTAAGSILWPYAINTGGLQPEEFEIVKLTNTQLILTYAAAGTGSWSEATFWRFRCNEANAMAQDAPNGWTWDTTDGGAVWGNMGYCGGKGEDVYTGRSGQWWGVTSTEEFNGQLNHTDTGDNAGDGDLDAYMVFGADNVVTSFNAAGNQIRQSDYRFVPVKGSDWKVADLQITGSDGGILWPFEINSGGNKPSTYEVVYMKDNKMVLVYPDGGDFASNGNWGEASFWRFMKK